MRQIFGPFWRILAGASAALGATAAEADQVVIQRNVTVREAPVRSSDVVDFPAIGTALELLDEGARRSGYYHVRLPDGREGWVYQTFVRRVEDEAPPATSLAALGADRMTAHFIDVDQGSAALLEFSCGAVLIDAGGRNEQARQHLLDYLETFFSRRTDLGRRLAAVFVTHTHIDHNRSLRRVAETFEVGGYVHSGIMTGSGRSPATWMIGHTGSKTPPIPAPGVMDVSAEGLTSPIIDPLACAGVNPRIHIYSGGLSNNPGWRSEEFEDENNHSLVIRVDFGEASFLFTGDLETAGIERLLGKLENDNLLDVDVYVAGHHGSHNGTTAELLTATTPEVAIISMGPHTVQQQWTAWAYGHPRRSLVQLLDGAVSRRRPAAKNVMVGDGVRNFSSYTMSDAIYATGWDGDIVVAAGANGALQISTSR